MRPLVAPLLLLLLSFSSHAATVVGPERPVTPPAYGEAWGWQAAHPPASDGTDFLFLWTDGSRGRAGLYAAVVDGEGAPRPVPARRIAAGAMRAAHAVWTGEAYLLLWTDQTYALYTARLDRDAQLISGPSLLLTSHYDVLGLAWEGERALAVVTKLGDTYGLLLDASGAMVRNVTLPLRQLPNLVRVAAAAESFTVVWSEVTVLTDAKGNQTPSTSLHAARVSTGGEAGVRVDLHAAQVNMSFRVASDGARVGIAVAEYPTPMLRPIVFDPRSLAVTALPPLQIASSETPHAIATGDGFAIAFLEHDASRTLHLTVVPFGSTVRRSVPLGNESGYALQLASSGGAVMAVWQEGPLLHGARLDRALTRRTTTPRAVATSAIAQDLPAVAAGADGALVLWVDLNGPTSGRLLAVRVNRAGDLLDATPIVVGDDPIAEFGYTAVFTGEVWLVAWHRRSRSDTLLETHVATRRIARDGTLPDAEPRLYLDAGQPALASNGEVTVLAMVEARAPGLAAVRFARDGTPIDAAPRTVTDAEVIEPVMTTNGREFFVAWWSGRERWPEHTPKLRGVQAMRLGRDGAPIDAAPIVIADSSEDEHTPRVASDGEDFLVLYTRGPRNLHAKRVLRNGALAGTTGDQQGTAIGSGDFAQLAFLDGRYLIVSSACCTAERALYARALGRDGVPLDEPRVVQRPLHAFGLGAGGGRAWIAYSRHVDDETFGNVPRVFVRVVAEEPGRRRAARK